MGSAAAIFWACSFPVLFGCSFLVFRVFTFPSRTPALCPRFRSLVRGERPRELSSFEYG